jgi:hypothetical protein
MRGDMRLLAGASRTPQVGQRELGSDFKAL